MKTISRRRLLMTGAGLPAAAMMPHLAQAQPAADPGRPAAAPIHVGRVGLRARDAAGLARWYEVNLGLRRLETAGDRILLGAGNTPLLEITGDPALRLSAPSTAGLYHTAFLLPGRAELGRWIIHAIQNEIPVDGVADHLVSEAIYLTDPEGNGVEIYADRPSAEWTWRDGEVEMATDPLNVQSLLALAPLFAPPIYTAPDAVMIGHVHLRVGDAAVAGAWWRDEMGFDVVRQRQGATFLSTGGYHHHIAVNEWQSAGAGPQSAGESGLAYVALVDRGAGAAATVSDPWGVEIRILAG